MLWVNPTCARARWFWRVLRVPLEQFRRLMSISDDRFLPDQKSFLSFSFLLFSLFFLFSFFPSSLRWLNPNSKKRRFRMNRWLNLTIKKFSSTQSDPIYRIGPSHQMAQSPEGPVTSWYARTCYSRLGDTYGQAKVCDRGHQGSSVNRSFQPSFCGQVLAYKESATSEYSTASQCLSVLLGPGRENTFFALGH